jgi:hypothetical protein
LNASGTRIAFVREAAPDEPAADELWDRLDALFPLAQWTFVVLQPLPTVQSADWKGDSPQWDQRLAASTLTLDRTGHEPFSEVTANPTDDTMTRLT